MVQMQKHEGDGVVFWWKLSTFLLRSLGSKSLQLYISFRTPTQSSLPSNTHHIARGYASYIACHKRNFCGTSAEKYLHPVYFWKQVGILLCYSHTLRGISTWVSSCLLWETGIYPVIPTPQLMRLVKGILRLIFNCNWNDNIDKYSYQIW